LECRQKDTSLALACSVRIVLNHLRHFIEFRHAFPPQQICFETVLTRRLVTHRHRSSVRDQAFLPEVTKELPSRMHQIVLRGKTQPPPSLPPDVMSSSCSSQSVCDGFPFVWPSRSCPVLPRHRKRRTTHDRNMRQRNVARLDLWLTGEASIGTTPRRSSAHRNGKQWKLPVLHRPINSLSATSERRRSGQRNGQREDHHDLREFVANIEATRRRIHRCLDHASYRQHECAGVLPSPLKIYLDGSGSVWAERASHSPQSDHHSHKSEGSR